jgi:hypothetical protein
MFEFHQEFPVLNHQNQFMNFLVDMYMMANRYDKAIKVLLTLLKDSKWS